MQVEIRQQGRKAAPLGDSLLGPGGASSSLLIGLDNGTLQELADQRQHRAVGDPSLQTLDQSIVGDRVEVRFQIRVVDLSQPGGEVLADRVDRLMGVPAWTESVGTVQEVGLKDRLEHQQYRRLNDPVFNRGNSQRSHPAVRLGDIHAFDRLRPVSLGAQLGSQLREEDRRARAIDDVLARHAVHAGAPL